MTAANLTRRTGTRDVNINLRAFQQTDARTLLLPIETAKANLQG